MEELARAEYPSLLAQLQPGQAVQILNERVRRINKVNLEIAEWFQERRRIEEQYVLSLRKLAQYRVPASPSELGVFQVPWARVLGAIERTAQSHHRFAENVERDVESPLRAFQQRNDMSNIYTVANNLANVARDLEDAQGKADKLSRKGGKTSSQKMDMASSKLESAQQQWESQAPFVFESLQALDESRVNQLRDYLTQYQTHETDQSQRLQKIAEETLAVMLEINTETEIQGFVHSIATDRPTTATRTSTRRSSVVGPQSPSVRPPSNSSNLATQTSNSAVAPTPAEPPTPAAVPEDREAAPPVAPVEQKSESKLRRLGTILGGRRRQSVQGGFGQLTSQKSGSSSSFGRLGGGSGRGVSPRGSQSNLHDNNRLSSLAEDPESTNESQRPSNNDQPSQDGINGKASAFTLSDPQAPIQTNSATVNGADRDIANVPPPPGPPPGQRDAEGFVVRAPMNDPISEAQREAAGDESEQPFKLNISNQPVADEDPQEKMAAFSSVANTLKRGPATQRSGTVRGRRDVRNTIYKPAPNSPDAKFDSALSSIPGSSSFASSIGRLPAAPALVSDASGTGISDNQSVRSGTSLGSFVHSMHPEMNNPGLNSSIIETVSAQFDDGVIKSATIAGEIAFVNNASTSGESKTYETIRINNFPRLEKIGPNRIFVQNASPDQLDQFALDLSHLSKTSIAFSYRVFADESDPPALAAYAPLLLKPAWKPQGDKLGLLLQYQLNPSCEFSGPVTLHNVVFVATYQGKASGAQTKPSGTHLKEKQIVYWRLGDVTLTSDVQKIVCRITGAEGVEPTPGHIEARWEYSASSDTALASGISVSRLDEKGKGTDDDPFSDLTPSDNPQSWVAVPLSTKLISGKYEGK